MAPSEKVLPHLRRVKRTGPDSWQACCPAHDDGSPSLHLTELDDDRLLLHCFGGCSVEEVVGALGLQVADLYPQKRTRAGGHQPVRRAFSAANLIDLAAWEAGVVVAIVASVLNGNDEIEFDRLLMAASRLADVKEAVHGCR